MALASKKHNFIFIHIYKCGGNSIRRALGAPSISQQDYNPSESFEIHGVHANIADVKKHLTENRGADFYRDAFKFSVVRNPYSHIVSLYRYIRNSKIHNYHDVVMSQNFYQYLHWYIESMDFDRPYGANKHQFMHQFLDNEMNYIARLEHIDLDMKTIFKKVGLPLAKVPMVNRFNDKLRIPWRNYFMNDTRCIDFVKEHFAEDFNKFGYSMEIT